MDGKLLAPGDRAAAPAPLRQALSPHQAYPHVVIVRDWATLSRIGRLRYAQYVEAQSKPYRSIVPQPDCLIELADFSGVNICGLQQGRLTAAMRINLLLDEAVSTGPALVSVGRDLGLDLARVLICTRLVRAPDHGGSHAADLVRFVRRQTVQAGYRYCLMQTAPRLGRYFARFNFHPTGITTEDPAAGPLHVMLLDTAMQPELRREAADVAA